MGIEEKESRGVTRTEEGRGGGVAWDWVCCAFGGHCRLFER